MLDTLESTSPGLYFHLKYNPGAVDIYGFQVGFAVALTLQY